MEIEAEKSREEENSSRRVYCVTGANGYIGSWLVKVLLQRGYKVHATVRDPGKAFHLLSLWTNVNDQLRLYKADLLEEGSFDEAVKGCHGVFHVAAFMEFNVPCQKLDTESYVKSSIIEPAIKGTINLLKSCVKSKSVRKVVFTSSISTLTAKDVNGRWREVVDETCQIPLESVWSTKASGWVYVLSKRLTEESAFKFSNEEGIDLVSIITTTVGGPFLTLNIPSSIEVLLSPITNDAKFFSILSAVSARMGSIALVHIEDICNAHLFLMEHGKAGDRYICCVDSCEMDELVYCMRESYPCSNMNRSQCEYRSSKPCEISSNKLKELGFVYKHNLKSIISETISYCVNHGFLPAIKIGL